MKLDSLHDLLIHELEDLYAAEQQIVEALPKMEEAAHAPELKDAFAMHLDQTKEHVSRLEEVAKLLEVEFETKTCEGMKGIIKEGEKLLTIEGDADVMDAGLIGAGQKVEHYEICGYGTVIAYAKLMGHTAVVDVLRKTAEEEGEANKKLNALAQATINKKASN
jgi:ferritin-like metal-binding protein YciE